MDLQAPVQFVKGIGPQRAEALAKAGVRTVEDLLLHLPLRYEDRRSFAQDRPTCGRACGCRWRGRSRWRACAGPGA